MNYTHNKWYIYGGAVFAGLCFILYIWPFYILNPGYLGIHLRMGRIVSVDRDSGLYFQAPLIDDIVMINTRIQKCIIETESLSKDLQFVSIGIALNYQVEDALSLWKEVGRDFEQVIINPLAQESIKAIVAQYTAEELIQQRHEAKDRVLNDIRDRLVPRFIRLIDFNFVHLDFHDEFMRAVEGKQIAQQTAMTEKNLTEKVLQKIVQQKALADADAYEMRLKADTSAYSMKVARQNITDEFLELKKIEKWNGELPKYVGNGVPLLSLD